MEPWIEQPTPRATVLLRSPYPRVEQDIALPWLEQGYAVALQDMRFLFLIFYEKVEKKC